MKYVYFGHHKCASSFILDILRDIGGLLGLSMVAGGPTQTLPLGYHTAPLWAARIQQRREGGLPTDGCILTFRNADEEIRRSVAQSGSYRGFHVIRDPRNMLVSGYSSHFYSHPLLTQAPWFELQREVDSDAGADLE